MAASKRNTGDVNINEYGRRIGESRGGVTDHEVQRGLELLDDGLSQRQIAATMEISRSRVSAIAGRKA